MQRRFPRGAAAIPRLRNRGGGEGGTAVAVHQSMRFISFVSSVVVVMCSLSVGCTPRRVVNQTMVGSVVVAPVSTGGDGGESQVAAGAHLMAAGAETDEDWMTSHARADLAIGGNGNGALSHQSVDAQVGVALWDEDDHLFARVGVFATVETDPLTSFSLLELPTLFVGYQHHGRDTDDPLHLDIGPRFSFAVAGRAGAHGQNVDAVAAPGVGGGFLLMEQGIFASASVMYYAEQRPLLVVRSSACLAAGLALCVDVRHVRADFGLDVQDATYVGVRTGVGLSTGLSW